MRFAAIVQNLKMGVQIEMRSKLTIFSWFLVGLIPVLTFVLVWTTLLGDRDSIGDYTRDDFILYYFLTTITYFIVYGRFDWTVARGIKDGYLNRFLIKPHDFVLNAALVEQGYKIISMFFAIPVFAFLAWAMQVRINISFSWEKLGLLLISLLIGAFVWGMYQAIVGCIAFWTNETWAFHELSSTVVDLFTGLFIPLSLLPGVWQAVSNILPFKYMGYVPITIILDKNTNIIGDIFYQAIWLVILFIIYKVVWRLGIRRYSGVGG